VPQAARAANLLVGITVALLLIVLAVVVGLGLSDARSGLVVGIAVWLQFLRGPHWGGRRPTRATERARRPEPDVYPATLRARWARPPAGVSGTVGGARAMWIDGHHQ
jgi:hypothetical protein